MDEDPFENDSEFDFEEEEFKEEEPELTPPEDSPSSAEEEAPKSSTLEAPLSPIGQIPMMVSVEVGKVKLPAEQLLNLQPGNLLSLHLPKSPRVSLAVNGQIIGRGELVEIGDMIGVRILEIS
ncbi:MAG: type III secretion system cytoplasmic ring protein SctQ [Verrucomicrobia bacterium]|nr:type III secretion system cytoplasmic ring protein SctQ [Verrucomicrobiota bacterium]